MAEIKWIKITTTMFDDEKIKLIESMPDRDAVLVVWFKLLVQAGKCNAGGYLMLNNKIPYNDEMLASLFNRPLNTVRMALEVFERFEMIEFDNNFMSLINWEKHQNLDGMQKVNELNRLRKQKQRLKQKSLCAAQGNENMSRDSHVTVTSNVTSCHATDLDLKDLKTLCAFPKIGNARNEIEETEGKALVVKDEDIFFEKIWNLYPLKKGKAAVSKSQKITLLKQGFEIIETCIQRYIKTKPSWQKMQNGSTFFSTGYVDYLDENFRQTEINNSKTRDLSNYDSAVESSIDEEWD